MNFWGKLYFASNELHREIAPCKNFQTNGQRLVVLNFTEAIGCFHKARRTSAYSFSSVGQNGDVLPGSSTFQIAGKQVRMSCLFTIRCSRAIMLCCVHYSIKMQETTFHQHRNITSPLSRNDYKKLMSLKLVIGNNT